METETTIEQQNKAIVRKLLTLLNEIYIGFVKINFRRSR